MNPCHRIWAMISSTCWWVCTSWYNFSHVAPTKNTSHVPFQNQHDQYQIHLQDHTSGRFWRSGNTTYWWSFSPRYPLCIRWWQIKHLLVPITHPSFSSLLHFQFLNIISISWLKNIIRLKTNFSLSPLPQNCIIADFFNTQDDDISSHLFYYFSCSWIITNTKITDISPPLVTFNTSL